MISMHSLHIELISYKPPVLHTSILLHTFFFLNVLRFYHLVFSNIIIYHGFMLYFFVCIVQHAIVLYSRSILHYLKSDEQ